MSSTITYHSSTTGGETSNNQGSDPGGNSFLDVLSAFFSNLNVSIDASGTRITDKLGNATIEYFKPTKQFARDERFQATVLEESKKLRIQLWVLYGVVIVLALFFFLKRG